MKLYWRPDDFTPNRPPRKVSWLELFHDLVYVVAISQLAHGLLHTHGLSDFLLFTLLFALVSWSWMNGTYYFDLHGNQGLWTRGSTWVQMVCAACVAITVGHVFEGHHRAFAIAFSAMQLLITLLWWSTGMFDPKHRPLSVPHTATYAVALGCLVVSIFATADIAIRLWTVAILLNFGVELIIFRRFEKLMDELKADFKPSASIVERFGLFTIIVLGEGILGILAGMEDPERWHLPQWTAFILSMGIAFLLWWLYFEVLGDREAKPGFGSYVLLNLLHLPLFASFAMLGPGLRLILAEGAVHDDKARWMVTIAIAVVMTMIVALSTIMSGEHLDDKARVREGLRMCGAAVVVLLVPFILPGANTMAFLALLMAVLTALVVQGTLSGAYPKLLVNDRK
ncbi:MAG: low temperature requirement protein A [Flavobacteriales bacterium]